MSLEQGQLLKFPSLDLVMEIKIRFHFPSKGNPPPLIITFFIFYLNQLPLFHAVSNLW